VLEPVCNWIRKVLKPSNVTDGVANPVQQLVFTRSQAPAWEREQNHINHTASLYYFQSGKLLSGVNEFANQTYFAATKDEL